MVNGSENGISTEYIYKDSTGTLIGKYIGNVINDKKNGKWQVNFIKNGIENNLSYSHYENDVKEGQFREIHGDTLIYGNYKNGLINGKYSLYRDFNKLILGGNTETDTTKLVKTSIGQFVANKKQGLWKNYH
jgi:hypothetical protein